MPHKIPAAGKTAVSKPKSAGKKTEVAKTSKLKAKKPEKAEKAISEESAHLAKPAPQKDKYVFATGRRKTAVANVRLFSGKGESLINKKILELYFSHPFYLQEIEKPFSLTGQADNFHFVCSLSGGGIHAQAKAVQHGLATALAEASPEHRKILKKNGLLTRDDRKKERKKPGLKRARRAPQWAKR